MASDIDSVLDTPLGNPHKVRLTGHQIILCKIGAIRIALIECERSKWVFSNFIVVGGIGAVDKFDFRIPSEGCGSLALCVAKHQNGVYLRSVMAEVVNRDWQPESLKKSFDEDPFPYSNTLFQVEWCVNVLLLRTPRHCCPTESIIISPTQYGKSKAGLPIALQLPASFFALSIVAESKLYRT